MFEFQLPLWQPPVTWMPTPVNRLPSWAGAKRIGIDIETHDPLLRKLGPGVRRGARIIGISFKIEDGPGHYCPIGHPEDNLPREHVLAYFRDQFKTFDGDIVGANLSYDCDFLWEAGVAMPKVRRYRDIQVAEPLLDELQMSYSMENIALRHGLPGKNEAHLRQAAEIYGVDAKKEMWKLPGRFVGTYAIDDAALPLAVLRRQERRIEEQDLGNIYDLEMRLTPILVRMRRRGVKVDQAHLQRVEDWTIVEQRKELEKIRELSGVRLKMEDVNKTAALVPVLQQIANIKFKHTEGSGKKKEPVISIDKFFLEALKHPIADAILRARKMDKVRGTFCGSIREHMCNGRIHGTFNQMRRSADATDQGDDDQGGRYGRLSACDPNFQQQPARDPEVGKLWRSIFIPDDGCLWAACDFSQQEPRLTYHYAALAGCSGADAMVRRFCEDLDADSHTEMTKMVYGADCVNDKKKFKEQRGFCKTIFLGLCYGMGGGKMCRKLNKPTQWKMSQRLGKMIEVAGAEGQAILDEVDRRMPFLKQIQKMCERRAQEKGYIVTLLGRRCRFPKKADGSIDWAHKALNRLIQGSAADWTKKALVDCEEAGHAIQLTVHDELDTSVRDEKQANEIGEIMRTSVKLLLPAKVDVEVGKSWGDSMG